MQKKITIHNRLVELELLIRDASQNGDAASMIYMETEHHILSLYYDNINISEKRDTSVQNICSIFLESLGPRLKLSIMCLTRGMCDRNTTQPSCKIKIPSSTL